MPRVDGFFRPSLHPVVRQGARYAERLEAFKAVSPFYWKGDLNRHMTKKSLKPRLSPRRER